MLSRGGRAYRFRERVFNRANRILLPHMADPVRRETEAAGDDAMPEPMKVIDNGADTTIVSFSSAAMLHTGRPTSEFESFFQRQARPYNLVLFRDIHRSVYHLTPDGEPGGLEWYRTELENALAALGASRHVAIGDSGGAAAAIYFGTKLGFETVVAFSPPFPMHHWISPVAQLRAYFDVPLLIKEPSAYWEHVLIAGSATFMFYLPIGLRCGFDSIFNPIATYLEASERPRLTIFYGEGSRPETKIIAPLRGLPDVTINPLPTAKHFCMVALARTGRLGSTIMEAIEPLPASGEADTA